MPLSRPKALAYIEKWKVALAFPDANRKDTPSLWSCYHPRTPMRWEWDVGGDHKVADLWIFREELSRSGKTAYAKWYRGKSTFIDLDFLPHLLSSLGLPKNEWDFPELSPVARQIYEALLENSPLSTKGLKKLTGLRGRDFEASYHAALRELWQRLWIVGWGEKDEGAFPSLNMAATKVIFERAWKEAGRLAPKESQDLVCEALQGNQKVLAFYRRLCKKIK